MATINNIDAFHTIADTPLVDNCFEMIDAFVHTIADTPLLARGSLRPMSLEKGGPTDSPSSSSSPRRKTGWSTNSWNGWEQPRPKPTSGSTGRAAASETPKATPTSEKSAPGHVPVSSPFSTQPTHMALSQNVPATRPQSPLTRGAGGIAKAAHAHPWDPGTTATRR